MQTHTHNGADQARAHTHPARPSVEAAFKNAGLTPDQAHSVMDALDEYVAAIAHPQKPAKQKRRKQTRPATRRPRRS